MSKIEDYKQEVLKLHSEGLSSRKIVKTLEDKHGQSFSKSTVNYALGRWGVGGEDNETHTEQNEDNYSDNLIGTDAFKDYCRREGIDINRVKSAKYVNHSGQQKFNIVLDYVDSEEDSVDYKAVIDEIIGTTYEVVKGRTVVSVEDRELVTRLVYTDTHIAMCTDIEGTSMYATPWDEKSLMETVEVMCEYVRDNRVGDTLIIDDLGDVLDGWDGYTTRGGHKLPQNMSNQKAFKVALKFKMAMLDILMPYFRRIICHNVSADNHAGSFAMILNHAFMRVAHERYDNVEVINYERFIEHYFLGRHAFVLTHGKDHKSLKFGFKPKLDSVQIEKIEHYLKHNEQGSVYKHADFIWVDKGDSHQLLFDYSTAQDFFYMNHIALSPASEWVMTNYKKGERGFTIQHIDPQDKNIKLLPIIL